jgi:hypothetical protein
LQPHFIPQGIRRNEAHTQGVSHFLAWLAHAMSFCGRIEESNSKQQQQQLQQLLAPC